MSRENTIHARQGRVRQAFLEQLKRTPTIEQSCQKASVSRSTVCRWRRCSKRFDAQVEESLRDGRAFMSDVAETQLFSLIGEKKFEAIRLYLSTHNERYTNKLELKGSVTHRNIELTKEQKKAVARALKLAALNKQAYGLKEETKEK